jgi:hypothetical protein
MQDNSDMTYYRSNLSTNFYNAVAFALEQRCATNRRERAYGASGT